MYHYSIEKEFHIPEESIYKWYSYRIRTFMKLINRLNDNEFAYSRQRIRTCSL